MQRKEKCFQKRAGLSLKAAFTVTFLYGTLAWSQVAGVQSMDWPAAQPGVFHTVAPWTAGAADDAQVQSVQGTTIPMSTFSHVASKDGKTYTSTIVGKSPFAPATWGLAPQVIQAVVVPVIFTTGNVTFNPTTGDLCDQNVSPVTRFLNSPLVRQVPMTVFNQNVNDQLTGTTQFLNGFRRSEFWNAIGGNAKYSNPIDFTSIPAITINGAPLTVLHGATSSGCPTTLGALPWGSNPYQSQIQSLLENQVIPGLLGNGLIATNQFVIFLFHNVVQQVGSNGYVLGFHGATGNPVQTYAVVDWDMSNVFGPSVTDASVASHELAEWMDDPLGTNLTPAWGNLGQTVGCQTNWEAGDPLSGTLMAPIVVPSDPYKFPYHMQDLAFYSFFFNGPTDPSVGASYYIYRMGTFSLRGTYLSAAQKCQPGGLGPFGGKW